MTKWIEEENGEVWIPTSTAAKMLGIGMQGVNHMLQRGILVHVRKPARNRTNYYLLSEVEALARNTKRVVKLVTHETRQESRIPGDLAKVDKTFLTGKEVMKFLTINNTALSWYVNHGDLTSYQSVPGRSPHRFDPYEVRILKHKRERLKRIRQTNIQFRANEARISGKPVPRPPRTDALHASDLLPFEHHMGTWITVRERGSRYDKPPLFWVSASTPSTRSRTGDASMEKNANTKADSANKNNGFSAKPTFSPSSTTRTTEKDANIIRNTAPRSVATEKPNTLSRCTPPSVASTGKNWDHNGASSKAATGKGKVFVQRGVACHVLLS